MFAIVGCAPGISASHARHLVDSCEVQVISYTRRGTHLTLRDGRQIATDDDGSLVAAADRAQARCGHIGILRE